MKAASLFSGIGAPEVAMPEWDWLWHAEIEPFPCAVMRERHPHSINLGDVTADDFTERAIDAGRPDVLVFGSPCQSFSVAGQRLGLDDPRGNLALVALGIVARVKPRWFVFENVPGLLSSDEGRDWGIFLRTVDDIGYRGAWTVLDAQYAGVAQRRERLFFVGHARDWRRAAAVLLESEGLCGHSPPSREAGKGTTHGIASSIGASGRGFERAGETRGQDPVVAEITPTIRAGANQTGGTRPPGTDVDTADSLIVSGAVSSKWAKQSGGPAGDECYNLVALQAVDIRNTQTLQSHHKSNSLNAEPTVLVANALQERDAKGPDSSTKAGHLIVADPIQANEARTYSLAGNNPRPRNIIPVAIPFDTTQVTSDKNYSTPQPGDPCHPLAGTAHPPAVAMLDAVAFQTRFARNGRGGPTEIAAPITAEAGRTGKGDSAQCVIGFATSSLDTPREDGLSPPLKANLNGQGTGAGPSAFVAIGGLRRAGNPEGADTPTMLDDGTAPTLDGQQQIGVMAFKASHFTRDKDGAPSDAMPPLSADADKGDQDPIVQVGTAVRRLSPIECSRLMGFPDDYLDVIYRNKPTTDSPKYRALGNSMAVPVVSWILRRIEYVDRIGE